MDEFRDPSAVIVSNSVTEQPHLFQICVNDVQHIVPVLLQNRGPHLGGALGQPDGRGESTRRKVENVLLILFLLKDRQSQSERGDVRDMRHVCGVHVVAVSVHKERTHIQRIIQSLNHLDRLRI